MKQADVLIGMEVYCTDAPGSNRSHLWTVDGLEELPTSNGQQHKWRLTRTDVVRGRTESFTTTAISARLRYAN